MSQKNLDSLAISIFCENLAMMLAAGIPAEEAVGLLAEDAGSAPLADVISQAHDEMLHGATLADAVRSSGRFPTHVSEMLDVGHEAGRLEDSLKSLSEYYKVRAELRNRLKSAVVYPTVMLFVMAAIIIVMLVAVLPVFTGVYTSLVGAVASSSYGYITLANVICWVALVVVLLFAVVLLIASRPMFGNGLANAYDSFFVRHIPALRDAAYKMAVSSFTSSLGTLMAGGLNSDEAFGKARGVVESRDFDAVAEECAQKMAGGSSMAQAIYDVKLIDPLYARMLLSAARTGNLDESFARISRLCSEDAYESIGRIVDTIEPVLAGVLAIVVGLSLISIMLPLVGIMGSIG